MENNIRDLQLVCLEILKEIDRICKKHNILYWLEGGSMLGAVRHHGFIPWDDDLDIAMFREDYNRFLEIAAKDLGKSYFLQTFKTDSNMPIFFAKIRKNNTFIDSKPEHLLNIHKGIFVDIFPVDRITEKRLFQLIHCQQIKWNLLINLFLDERVKTRMTEKLFIKSIRKIAIKFLSCKRNAFRGKLEKCLQKYNKRKKEKFSYCSLTAFPSPKWIYRKEWLVSFKEVQFEDLIVRIPIGYHELLTHAYGDYMTPPPKEKQVPEHGVKFSTDTTNRGNKQ